MSVQDALVVTHTPILATDCGDARNQGAAVESAAMDEQALQDRYSPSGICFGCGPANDKGLRIKSRVQGAELVADWTPEEHHQAWPGMLNGGIVGALLDCHGNWAATWHLMTRDGLDRPPCTVTAEFSVRLRRPTPVDRPLRVRARAVSSAGPKVTVEASLEAHGQVTAICHGVFVAVREDHPAYHRW
jgi:acyl-coenzyme A thioesterase PaaI-like protein